MPELVQGFAVAFSPGNFVWALLGALVGTVVGILPGLGPVATVSILLPLTLRVSPTASLIFLGGIYYGAQFGGSTTSILLNIPGESASVVTCLDGYPLAQKGKAGLALAMSAIGSFIAGTIGLILFSLAAMPLTELGLAFGPPEQFMLMLMALAVAGTFGESLGKGLAAASAGLLLAVIGSDPISGINRFVFGIYNLQEGIDFVPVAVGLFAIGEVLSYLWSRDVNEIPRIPPVSLRELIPTIGELLGCLWAMVRGSLIGFFTGLLPGMGTVPSTFISYSLEKRLSKHPERFGRGMIEGVAAPEAANNSAVIGALLPMFTLGLPTSPTTALLLAGLIMWGLQPGPLLMTQHSELVWPVIASLYIANFALLVINVPGSVLLAQITRIPLRWMMPVVLAICLVSAHAGTGNAFGLILTILFGIVGFVFRRAGYPMAPLVFGLLVGRSMEQNLRRSLLLSQGNPVIFVSRPLCLFIIGLTIVLLVVGGMIYRAGQKEPAAVQGQPEPKAAVG
jgi:putative tricarboxylic transport membrane protein